MNYGVPIVLSLIMSWSSTKYHSVMLNQDYSIPPSNHHWRAAPTQFATLVFAGDLRVFNTSAGSAPD